MPQAECEQGSITVVLVAVIAALFVLLTAVFVPLNHRLALVRAQSVADLSALAGAMELHNGSGDGCARVTALLAVQGFSASRSTCELVGADLRVTLAVPGMLRASSVVSVAGPA